MKKTIAVLMALIMIIMCFAACSSNTTATTDNNKLQIVATFFPQYDWLKEISGQQTENVEITLLFDDGTDLHSYQPTVEDFVKISSCDMFIYIGGESESWVEDALKNATNENMTVINLIDVLGENVVAEETVEGMKGTEKHKEESEPDEHIWLSLNNAITICEYITEKLCLLDSENESTYKENANAYIEKLRKLDAEYTEITENAKYSTLVVADRFPFRYLVDDYSLDYYAAFSGCSAETGASFETVIFLANKLDEYNLGSVIVTESSDASIANMVISNTASADLDVLVLNSMQSVSAKDIENGAKYLDIMKNNLEVLTQALN